MSPNRGDATSNELARVERLALVLPLDRRDVRLGAGLRGDALRGVHVQRRQRLGDPGRADHVHPQTPGHFDRRAEDEALEPSVRHRDRGAARDRLVRVTSMSTLMPSLRDVRITSCRPWSAVTRAFPIVPVAPMTTTFMTTSWR